MTLNAKLTALKDAARGKLPEATQQIMAAALRIIAASGQEQRARKAGEVAPPFALEDHSGRLWSSAELLSQGPLVVNFYRGSW